MCRISVVGEDWANKGCHLHVRGVEVVLRPDHLGSVTCKKLFASTSDWKADAASVLVFEQLKDPKWRRRLIHSIERAMVFLLGVQAQKQPRARGSLREMRELLRALERWEPI
jgi:hypothetical protein